MMLLHTIIDKDTILIDYIVAGASGIEPLTHGFSIHCYYLLSYTPDGRIDRDRTYDLTLIKRLLYH
jgi:hypothetical protein